MTSAGATSDAVLIAGIVRRVHAVDSVTTGVERRVRYLAFAPMHGQA